MQLNLFFALVGGLWFWFAASLAGYSWIQMLKSPLVVGTVLGALTGNLETGLITGGSIEMVYLGMVAAGGNIPSDRVFAALIAVPIAIQTGVTPEVAVSIAVPLGVLGVFVNNLRRTVNAVFVHWADKAADEADVKKVWRCATTYPLILGFIIRFPLMFVINYFGADFVTAMLNVIPAWLLTGFNVMGGMLPALGFATTIFMIGKMKYLPLFIIGFFLVKYLQIPTMAAAIFGICMALLIMFMGDEKAFDGLNFAKDLDGEKKEQERLLSEKDVNGVFLRWIWTAELSNSFERMQALAVAASFAPALRKLYPNDEDLEVAIKRHLGFFNTQANWGCLIHGTVLAMEEQKAMGSDIPDEMITGIKTGLMGPLPLWPWLQAGQGVHPEDPLRRHHQQDHRLRLHRGHVHDGRPVRQHREGQHPACLDLWRQDRPAADDPGRNRPRPASPGRRVLCLLGHQVQEVDDHPLPDHPHLRLHHRRLPRRLRPLGSAFPGPGHAGSGRALLV